MKRITVDLEEDFYRKLKHYCTDNDVQITVLIRKLLAEELTHSGKKSKKAGSD
jgi:predicted DNA-binding ribbon-helix-helix protein